MPNFGAPIAPFYQTAALIRISSVKPPDDLQIEITLTTGVVVQHDIEALLKCPVFVQIRTDPAQLRRVRARRKRCFDQRVLTFLRMLLSRVECPRRIQIPLLRS